MNTDFTQYSGSGVASDLIQRERIEATGVRRIKRITSHSGHARFLATVEDTNLLIKRITAIPSPYHYAPIHQLYRTVSGELIFIVETAHKQYDVFTLPTDAKPFVHEEVVHPV